VVLIRTTQIVKKTFAQDLKKVALQNLRGKYVKFTLSHYVTVHTKLRPLHALVLPYATWCEK